MSNDTGSASYAMRNVTGSLSLAESCASAGSGSTTEAPSNEARRVFLSIMLKPYCVLLCDENRQLQHKELCVKTTIEILMVAIRQMNNSVLVASSAWPISALDAIEAMNVRGFVELRYRALKIGHAAVGQTIDPPMHR